MADTADMAILRRTGSSATAGTTAGATAGATTGATPSSSGATGITTSTATPPPPPDRTDGSTGRRGRAVSRLGRLTPVLLARAAHPRQAVLTAAGVTAAAALAGRSTRELGLVLATVLVGQAVLGWHNDLVDRERDRSHERRNKPVAAGLLDPGTVWFTIACAVLLLVPLSIANGVVAGLSYLGAVAVALVGNVVLRRGLLSWLPWAVSYALLPAFLSYGGWGGDTTGRPPEILVTVLAALLGVGVHVLVALPGLVADNQDGRRHLPLRLGLRLGATKVLALAAAWTALVVVALLLAGRAVGLSQ